MDQRIEFLAKDAAKMFNTISYIIDDIELYMKLIKLFLNERIEVKAEDEDQRKYQMYRQLVDLSKYGKTYTFEYELYTFKLMRHHRTAWNGYISFSKDLNVDEDTVNNLFPGGISYSGDDGDKDVLGFDTFKSGDAFFINFNKFEVGDTYKDYDYMLKTLKEIADGISRLYVGG